MTVLRHQASLAIVLRKLRNNSGASTMDRDGRKLFEQTSSNVHHTQVKNTKLEFISAGEFDSPGLTAPTSSGKAVGVMDCPSPFCHRVVGRPEPRAGLLLVCRGGSASSP